MWELCTDLQRQLLLHQGSTCRQGMGHGIGHRRLVQVLPAADAVELLIGGPFLFEWLSAACLIAANATTQQSTACGWIHSAHGERCNSNRVGLCMQDTHTHNCGLFLAVSPTTAWNVPKYACERLINALRVLDKVGVLQVVAVVAWKSLQSFLTWGGPYWNQVLQAEYAMPFWLVHCSHGVFGSLNQAPQHHFAQQVVGFGA